jgi:ketosteroid isomerase-like protein
MGVAREAAENVYAAMASGDIDAVVRLCAADCELVEAGSRLQGPAQIGAYLRVYFTALVKMRPEIRSMFECGNTVAAEICFVATDNASSTTLSTEGARAQHPPDIDRADFITFRDGKIEQWHVYVDMPAV